MINERDEQHQGEKVGWVGSFPSGHEVALSSKLQQSSCY
jgi:hypothetical protein